MPASARRRQHQLLFCADIRHTLGATEYALTSYLAIVLRARAELHDINIVAQLPQSLGGLTARLLYTNESLRVLAKSAGVSFQGDDEAACSHAHNDLRVTDKVRAADALTVTPLPVYDLAARAGVSTFLSGLWDALRAALRQRTNLVVSLSLLQASLGPLAHAGAALNEESLRTVTHLSVLPPPPASCPSSAASSLAPTCAYVFLGLHMGVGAINLASSTRNQESFRSTVASVVANKSRANGLSCARLNAVFSSDESRAAARAAFRLVDADFEVTLVEKHRFQSAVKQWSEFGGANGTASQSPTEELLENLCERHASYEAPLLITQSGTFWGDWVLAKRSSEGRPSVVMPNPSSARGTHEQLACGGVSRACGDCVFYRGHCASSKHRWLPQMGHEISLCTHKWQAGVVHGSPSGKGVQKVAVVGCR